MFDAQRSSGNLVPFIGCDVLFRSFSVLCVVIGTTAVWLLK